MAIDWKKIQPDGIRSWLHGKVHGTSMLSEEDADFIFGIWDSLEAKNRMGNKTAIDIIQVVMRHARKRVRQELEYIDGQIARKRRNASKGDKTPKMDKLVERRARVLEAIEEVTEAIAAVSRAFDKYYDASTFGKDGEMMRARNTGRIQ